MTTGSAPDFAAKNLSFQTMEGDEDGEKTIAQFNGTELNGRAMTVNEARPREG